jgi:hypothetical protein
MKQGSRLNKNTFLSALAVVILGVGLMPGLQATVSAADGLVLKTITDEGLPNPWIKGLFHDGERLIVTTTAGTVQRAPGEERFAPFAPGAGFKGASVTGWAEFGGKSWVGTESALNVREGGKWSSLDRVQQVQHAEELLYSDEQSLYALARVMYGGVLKFNAGNWTVVDRGAGTGIMNNATAILTRGDELFIGTTTSTARPGRCCPSRTAFRAYGSPRWRQPTKASGWDAIMAWRYTTGTGSRSSPPKTACRATKSPS